MLKRLPDRPPESPRPSGVTNYSLTGAWPEDGPEGDREFWEVFTLSEPDGRRLQAKWAEVRDTVLERWALESPGTRPWVWWATDAPRWPRAELPTWCRDEGNPYLERLAEPRRRLGGVGTERYRVLGDCSEFAHGLTRAFVTAADVAYWTSNEGAHGYAGGIGRFLGPFAGVAIDPMNPPTFESQASYLKRHALFLPGEEARLKAADFEPEAVRLDDGDAHH